MFDLRYHVASLAAVFLALVIGILVGVAISSHSSLTNPERAQLRLLNEQKGELEGRLVAEAQRADALAQSQQAAQALSQASYPLVVRDRLRGKRIGVVFIGSPDPRVRNDVQTALADAGASPALRFRALKVPIDATALKAALAGRPASAALADPTRLDALGRELGRELVLGGDTPLWNALSGQLIVERSGGSQRPLDGVVLIRSAPPQRGPTARFLHGFYSGLGASAAPLVGVETSSANPSALPVYRKAGISSVDDIQTPAGRLALVALLAGAPAGHYGLDHSADSAVLPALPFATTGG